MNNRFSSDIAENNSNIDNRLIDISVFVVSAQILALNFSLEIEVILEQAILAIRSVQ